MKRIIAGVSCLFVASLITSPSAYAIPSFARQTGLSCNVCHYDPPELTPFGRMFKLNGYTLTTPARKKVGDGKNLDLLMNLPLSLKVGLSDSAMAKKQPGTQNGSVAFPQDLSIYLAGQLAPHTGSFIEMAYDHSSDHITFGMADLRYANHTKLAGKSFVYGVDLNNQPTFEDLWNSTPGEGYPYEDSDVTPGSIASPALGMLMQDVAGIGAYGMWNNHLYGDVTLYRSEHAGGDAPLTGKGFMYNIIGVAPYWRAAWQQNLGSSYLEVGTYGIYFNSVPNGVTGTEDNYTDAAFDFSYEHPFGSNTLSVHGSFLHENADLNAEYGAGNAAFANHGLNQDNVDATYYFGYKYNLSAAYSDTFGQKDPVLYAPDPFDGSRTGSPDTRGYILQAGYWPVQNISLTVAYNGFTQFNGSSNNYDGADRNAADNNTTYAAAWFYF